MEDPIYDRREALRHGTTAILMGGLAVSAPRWLGAWSARGRGAHRRIAVWVADRAGHRAVALDADAIPVRSIDVEAPLSVTPRSDGGVLVQSASDSATGSHSEEYLGNHPTWGPNGQRGRRPEGRRETLLFDPAGDLVSRSPAPVAVSPFPSTLAAAVPHGIAATPVVTSRGVERLWVLRKGRRSHSLASSSSESTSIERWLRRVNGATSMQREQHWSRAFHIECGFDAHSIAAGLDGVWVAGGRSQCQIEFVLNTGRRVRRVTLPDVDRAEAIASASTECGGGLWVAAGGALARIDADAQRMPGQGGFLQLVDVASLGP